MTTICSICALAAHNGYNVHQSDIKTAFFKSGLHEEVYVLHPHGFVQKGKKRRCVG